MPAINFPEQPGLQTPENTFSPVSVPESSKNGITYTYDNGVWSVAPIEIGGGTGDGNASIITSDYPPNNPPPKDGDLWWNTSNNTLYIYYVDEDTSQWVVSTPNDNNGGAQIDVGEEPPSSPTDGALWWNTDDNTLYIYYDEGDGGTSQWVIASPGGSGGSGGVGGSLEIPASDEPPTLPSEGDLWWSTTDNTLYIYYRDEDTEQWVVTVPSAGIGTLQQVTDAGNNTTNDITLGTDKITLDATNGSATFAGGIDTASETTDGMQIDVQGGIAVQRQTEDGLAFTILSKTTNNVNIYANGSADFAGGKTNIYSNGVIRVGDNPGTSEKYGADMSPNGEFRLRSTENDAFRIYPNTTTTPVITLKSNGQASFTGYVNADSFTAQTGAPSGNTEPLIVLGTPYAGSAQGNIPILQTSIRSGGRYNKFALQHYSSSNNGYLGFYFRESNPLEINPKITFSQDGSGTFAGNVNANNVSFNLEPDNDDNYTTTTEEYTETESYTDPLGNTLEREVTKTRDVRTYTGPTLDVKERLTKADNALIALKAAAEAATDFAELKAAIVTALADI